MYTCAKKVSMTLTMGLSQFLHQVKDLQHSFVQFVSKPLPVTTKTQKFNMINGIFKTLGTFRDLEFFKAHLCYVTFLV